MIKQKAIICDLDGTLTNPSERRHFMEKKPKSIGSFYYNAPYDKPNVWCLELIDALFDKEYHLLFVSGRPEQFEHRGIMYNLKRWTIEWLHEYTPYGIGSRAIKLFMRQTGDKREDYIVKKEIYEKYIKDKYEVLFVIDDRKQVVDMWRSIGLVCLHCADGNY